MPQRSGLAGHARRAFFGLCARTALDQCARRDRALYKGRRGCPHSDIAARRVSAADPAAFYCTSARGATFRMRVRIAAQPMLECAVTGLLAWRGGQPGQVGNEAATAVFRQCRGSGSSPSTFFLLFSSPPLRYLVVSRSSYSWFCRVRHGFGSACVIVGGQRFDGEICMRVSNRFRLFRSTRACRAWAPRAVRLRLAESPVRAGDADTISR